MELPIQQFREEILKLYESQKEGMTEEQIEYLQKFQESPDSILCSIAILNGAETELPVLFTSVDIINKFIKSPSWDFSSQVISALFTFIQNHDEPLSVINKILVCLSDILIFDFGNFQGMFEQIPPNSQIDFLIILIEEFDQFSVDYYQEALCFLSEFIQGFLNALPLSCGFLRLLKAALVCFGSYELVLQYMDKMEESLGDTELIPHCTNIVNSILLDMPPIRDVTEIPEFSTRLFAIAIKLSQVYSEAGEFECACDLWRNMIGLSANMFENPAFATEFLPQQFGFLQIISQSPFNIPQSDCLIIDLCLVLAENENVPVYQEELEFLFCLLIRISETTEYRIDLDRAINLVFTRIPERATQIVQAQLNSPTPGLFFVACHCQLDLALKVELSKLVIQLVADIPPFILLTFIYKIGKNLEDFNDAWFPIIINLIPYNTSMAMNTLISFLERYPTYIEQIPQDVITYILQYLDESEIDLDLMQSICKPCIKFFKIISSIPPQEFLERLRTKVTSITVSTICDISIGNIIRYDNQSILSRLESIIKEIGIGESVIEFKQTLSANIIECAKQAVTENTENENLSLLFDSFIPEMMKLFQII